MIWRSCERYSIMPPHIKEKWIDNIPWGQAQLLAYESIRNYEEAEENGSKIGITG